MKVVWSGLIFIFIVNATHRIPINFIRPLEEMFRCLALYERAKWVADLAASRSSHGHKGHRGKRIRTQRSRFTLLKETEIINLIKFINFYFNKLLQKKNYYVCSQQIQQTNRFRHESTFTLWAENVKPICARVFRNISTDPNFTYYITG